MYNPYVHILLCIATEASENPYGMPVTYTPLWGPRVATKQVRSAVLYSAVLYSAVLHSMVVYSAVVHSAVVSWCEERAGSYYNDSSSSSPLVLVRASCNSIALWRVRSPVLLTRC